MLFRSRIGQDDDLEFFNRETNKWCVSYLKYKGFMSAEFEEIATDWSKILRWTKVRFRENTFQNKKWYYGYFYTFLDGEPWIADCDDVCNGHVDVICKYSEVELYEWDDGGKE